MSLDFEEVATGLGFPEGPVAMNDGSVLFVDIKKKTLMRLNPDKSLQEIAALDGGPNGLAIGPDGAAYVCNNGGVYAFLDVDLNAILHPGKDLKPLMITIPKPTETGYSGGSIQRVDLATGAVQTLYTSCDGRPLIAPDDIVFDAQGGFWFTDGGRQHDYFSEFGAVYYAKPDGSLITRAATVPTANGIGLSPDGTELFVADTAFGRLWKMKITDGNDTKGLQPGPLPGMPGQVVQTLDGYQWLDSLKVEADGRVCVGTLLTGGITVFSADGTTEHVGVPDLFTTNLCFGGEGMQDIWITASSTGKILKACWPRPGLKLAFTS